MDVTLNIINAFTLNGTGGNPAAVVLRADTLTKDKMQNLAKQSGLSETAFVSSSDVADFKLDFFTPSKQIPHCGHATIATFSFLRQQGHVADNLFSSKKTIDGNRAIQFDGDDVFMEQRPPVFSKISQENIALVTRSLGLSEKKSVTGMDIVNTGNSYLVIEVKNTDVLANVTPDFDLI